MYLSGMMIGMRAQRFDLPRAGLLQFRIEIDVLALLVQLGTNLLATFFRYCGPLGLQRIVAHHFAIKRTTYLMTVQKIPSKKHITCARTSNTPPPRSSSGCSDRNAAHAADRPP